MPREIKSVPGFGVHCLSRLIRTLELAFSDKLYLVVEVLVDELAPDERIRLRRGVLEIDLSLYKIS